MESLVLQIMEPLKRAAIVVALHASTAHLPAALAAAQRYAIRDGLGDLTEDDLRRALLFLRTVAANELARMAGAPSNNISADVTRRQR
jgi:hypothetical protein